MQERPVNGLRPASASVAGHDGRDHIYQLRQAGNLYAVGVSKKCDQDASGEKNDDNGSNAWIWIVVACAAVVAVIVIVVIVRKKK